jgi:hypothetical protein
MTKSCPNSDQMASEERSTAQIRFGVGYVVLTMTLVAVLLAILARIKIHGTVVMR